MEKVEVLCHSSIKIENQKIIYIDPFKIKEMAKDADIVLITHDHYDHFSEEDLQKVKKDNTIIIIPKTLLDKTLEIGFKKENILTIKPYEQRIVENIKIETIPAYNINKQFHPKENDWVGYIIEINKIRYYIAGDTDITEDNKKVKCDIALVPVGGTYTMNFEEAANLVNEINPKIAIPIHYGSIVGTEQDANNFIKLLNSNIEGKKLIKDSL